LLETSALGKLELQKKKKKKGWVGMSKRHFKSQAENYEILFSGCLSGFIYASVCAFIFFFFYNIAEVVNEF